MKRPKRKPAHRPAKQAKAPRPHPRSPLPSKQRGRVDSPTSPLKARDPHASPRSGTIPPPEHRWLPGQSGNPAGRPSAGLTLREHINELARADLSEEQLRAIARDESIGFTRRTAAERCLRLLEHGDLADLQPFLDGKQTMAELRAAGISTEVVKKAKVKTTQYGEEREVELHDRAGEEFDRICDRTEGKPRQAVDVTIAPAEPVVILEHFIEKPEG